jgi:hypothetical protein
MKTEKDGEETHYIGSGWRCTVASGLGQLQTGRRRVHQQVQYTDFPSRGLFFQKAFRHSIWHWVAIECTVLPSIVSCTPLSTYTFARMPGAPTVASAGREKVDECLPHRVHIVLCPKQTPEPTVGDFKSIIAPSSLRTKLVPSSQSKHPRLYKPSSIPSNCPNP